ncbi:uncharacterized protein LOC133863991 [Alnus glutinosa]|uniref:uncharacterized protein LOC133863991 n=1 Tax=Alnus glutinosa TaxID=3517 RepID=UPI002D76FA1F|nr:uncharacterized protein LOC133863991 [Alnus glutinosa]
MVKVVKRKKKEKRGQTPLSDFGNPPLEEKQQRKRTRPTLGPYPLRLSSYLIGTLRLLNPNQGSDDGLSGCHAITADECKRYTEQLVRTDGFEMDRRPRIFGFGLIRPCNIRDPDQSRRCILYSKHAIKAYNKWICTWNISTPRLKFGRVLKAMRQYCDLLRYYITFEAEELADGGQTKTYQAVVRSLLPIDVNISVLSFRECERVKGSGYHGKEWAWKDHIHRGEGVTCT